MLLVASPPCRICYSSPKICSSLPKLYGMSCKSSRGERDYRHNQANEQERGRGGRLVTVFGWGALRHEFAHRVPRLSPSGESIKDDSYGIQSPLREVYIAS